MEILNHLNLLVTQVYAQEDSVIKPVILNPLHAKSIQELVADVLVLVYKVGLPLIVLMFVYAGFIYVTAQGDTGKIKDAHNAFKYTVIGAIVVLGASVIAAVIKGTIDSLGQ